MGRPVLEILMIEVDRIFLRISLSLGCVYPLYPQKRKGRIHLKSKSPEDRATLENSLKQFSKSFPLTRQIAQRLWEEEKMVTTSNR